MVARPPPLAPGLHPTLPHPSRPDIEDLPAAEAYVDAVCRALYAMLAVVCGRLQLVLVLDGLDALQDAPLTSLVGPKKLTGAEAVRAASSPEVAQKLMVRRWGSMCCF